MDITYSVPWRHDQKPNKDWWRFQGDDWGKKVQTVQGQDQPNRPVVAFKVTALSVLFAWVCVFVC